MSSPEQLAGWACHALGPYAQSLMAVPQVVEGSPGATCSRPVPEVVVKLWLCLTRTDLKALKAVRPVQNGPSSLQALKSQTNTAAMMTELASEIQQTLEANPGLCVELEELRLSMFSAGT